MRTAKVTLIILCLSLILFGCTVPAATTLPKKEVSSYDEQVFKVGAMPEISISCDSSNTEVYSWNKNEVKFEITKKLRGNEETDNLEKKLKDFEVDIENKENKVTFQSVFGGKINSPIDKSVDLKVFIPKVVKVLKYKLDIGNVKFLDDFKGEFIGDINTANVSFNRIEAKINMKADMSGVTISSGVVKKDSSIKTNVGSINIKGRLEEQGNYTFNTGIGNVELFLPADSRLSLETIGALDINEFRDTQDAAKVHLESEMGKIAVKKTES